MFLVDQGLSQWRVKNLANNRFFILTPELTISKEIIDRSNTVMHRGNEWHLPTVNIQTMPIDVPHEENLTTISLTNLLCKPKSTEIMALCAFAFAGKYRGPAITDMAGLILSLLLAPTMISVLSCATTPWIPTQAPEASLVWLCCSIDLVGSERLIAILKSLNNASGCPEPPGREVGAVATDWAGAIVVPALDRAFGA